MIWDALQPMPLLPPIPLLRFFLSWLVSTKAR